MSKQAVRRLRLKSLRETLSDDKPSKAAFAAADAADAAREDLAQRRAQLIESGLYSPAGVEAQLASFKKEHAAKLRGQLDQLTTTAKSLITQGAPSVDLPADAQRILNHWTSLSVTQRNDALGRALSGRDPELAAVLAHPSNERYAGLTDNSLSLLRNQFTEDEVNEENAPRLQALSAAAEEISELLPTLEG
jgi:hypothetical protein